jgi:hypothetical protein
VEVAKCAWAGSACKTVEISTVRTADINYFTASLPSWLNALIATLRDFEILKCAAALRTCLVKDLPCLPVWPCAAAYRSWIIALLVIKFLSSLLTFLVVYFCRATALTLGGPQGPRPVTLPLAEENPEQMLKEMSAAVAHARALHQWGPVRAPLQQLVHGQGGVVVQMQQAPGMVVQVQQAPGVVVQVQQQQQQQQQQPAPHTPYSTAYATGASKGEAPSLPPGWTRSGPDEEGSYWCAWGARPARCARCAAPLTSLLLRPLSPPPCHTHAGTCTPLARASGRFRRTE